MIIAKKKIATFSFPRYPNKLKFKKFFISKSAFKTKTNVEIFSYSRSAFNLKINYSWVKFTPSMLFSSNFARLTYPYRKIIFRSLKYRFINENTIKGLKRLLAPNFRGKKLKKNSAIFFSRSSTFTFTKKPSAVRIGGGVGKKPRLSGFHIRPGQPLLTIYTNRPNVFLSRLKSLRKKFSGRFKTFVILFIFFFENLKI